MVFTRGACRIGANHLGVFMKLITAALAALLLSVSPASAEPSPHKLELAQRYFKSMHMETNFVAMVKNMLPAIAADAPPGVSTEAIQKITGEVLDEVMPPMLQDMEGIMTQACAQVFTEEELAALVAFYESPVGQSVVDKGPLLAASTSTGMAKLMPKFRALFIARMFEKLCADGACEPDKTPARTPS